jgi:1L-myo-inositol 1-phosphate cytidylyltransferase / CDP-L-myo-inositol myo-inositolphosphotransferase
MSTKCLIIAAGKGTRLRQKSDSKPLAPILGVALIERVIRCAFEAGADDFYVVIGYQGEQVRSFLNDLAGRMGVPITTIENDAWEKENGLSVLKAQRYLRDPFLLLMADHLFDPSIARELMEAPPNDGQIVLAVDGNTRDPLIDMQDVTRVRIESGRIVDIGKGLTDADGFDTGVFMCTPALFDALKRSQERHGDCSLSGAVRVLAAEGRARAVEINGRHWIDVDDSAAFKRAENTLLAALQEKHNDGPVSRYFNRPLSVRISRRLLKHRITPNQVSLFSFLISVAAAGLFALGGYPALLLGGLLAQFASIVDGCDGEVARLKFQSSRYGAWFDAVLDRYADAFLLFGLTWHAYAGTATQGLVLLTGFLAIIGSFMLSYTADKYDGLMRRRIGHGKGFRLGRDSRVFLIFLGAILNQAFLTLVVIAALMNIETIRRLIVCRGNGTRRAKPRPVISASIAVHESC